MKNEFEWAINDLVTLCSSEIMRYSMQNFMEWFSTEERYIIAKGIAKRSYLEALIEIDKYFKWRK